MANIFEQYGIKEVANFAFEALADEPSANIKKGDIVLYLDTLKVSTVETTAESVDARGGWGNPKLVSWDFGKDINVNLEDAVITWEEMRILMGAKMKQATSTAAVSIRKNAEVTFAANSSTFEVEAGDGLTAKGKHSLPADPAGITFHYVDMTNGGRGTATAEKEGTKLTFTFVGNDGQAVKAPANETLRIRLFWDDTASAEAQAATELTITPNDFPGTYKCYGDTLIRSAKTGADEAFQIVLLKAKLQSEITLQFQAEGDPSTFSATLNVLKDGDEMMKLIKY